MARSKKESKDTPDKKPPAKKGTPSPKQPPTPSTMSLSVSSASSFDMASPPGAGSSAFAAAGRGGVGSSRFAVAAGALRYSGVAAVSRPGSSTIQRLFNQTKAELPKDGLSHFGIKAASSGRRAESDKNSKLKVVLIKGENGTGHLVCRCEPNNPNYRNGSWSEKTFFDDIRKGADWATLINVDNDMLHWFDHDQPQLNPKGYNIRLFVIPFEEVPTEESVVQLGEHICQNINAAPNNNTTISIIPGQCFWIPTEQNPVWSDVIGSDAALKALVEKKGMPASGCYNTNREAIHSYFRPFTFTLDLARVLHAPIEQVHPELREEMNQENCKKPPLAEDEIEVELQDTDDDDDL